MCEEGYGDVKSRNLISQGPLSRKQNAANHWHVTCQYCDTYYFSGPDSAKASHTAELPQFAAGTGIDVQQQPLLWPDNVEGR